jgi:acetolactate decarboxylase
MKATLDRLPLAQAAAIQQWHPGRNPGSGVFKLSLNIAGYHFHFLSNDRTKGGHLLECSGKNLRVRVERLSDFHLCLPESEEFLRADLTQNPAKDLAYAEQAHKKDGA